MMGSDPKSLKLATPHFVLLCDPTYIGFFVPKTPY